MAMREDELDQLGDAEVLAKVGKGKKKKARTAEEKAQKQERARMRRAARERDKAISAAYKPIEEWDNEELARGRPRDRNGEFRGRAPQWVSRQVHEEAVKRFKDEASADMRGLVPLALDTVRNILTNDAEDEKGKPVVPAGVKLEAAKWTVEHLVGKPTQRTEMDISVKLQGILASVMVNVEEVSDEVGGTRRELLPAMDVESWDPDEEPGNQVE